MYDATEKPATGDTKWKAQEFWAYSLRLNALRPAGCPERVAREFDARSPRVRQWKWGRTRSQEYGASGYDSPGGAGNPHFISEMPSGNDSSRQDCAKRSATNRVENSQEVVDYVGVIQEPSAPLSRARYGVRRDESVRDPGRDLASHNGPQARNNFR